MTFVIVVVGSAHGLLSMLLHSPIKRETGESAECRESAVCARSKCAEKSGECNCESECK